MQHKQQQEGSSPQKRTRLRWSPALHAQFVAVVQQLGGAFQATPKRIQLAMNVPGLTLFHVKSHLQKYREVTQGGRPAGNASKKRSGGGDAGEAAAVRSEQAAAPEHEHEHEHEQQQQQRDLSAWDLCGAEDDGQCSPSDPFGDALLPPGWGTQPAPVVDAELAASLAPAGSLNNQQAAGTELTQQPPAAAEPRCAVCERAAQHQQLPRALPHHAAPQPATAKPDRSASQLAAPQRSEASGSQVAASEGADPAAAAAAGVAPAASAPATSRLSILESALRVQMEMQRQLCCSMEAQRGLQMQLEAHGQYIAGLLRCQARPPGHPTAAAGQATGSAKAGSRASSKLQLGVAGGGGGPPRGPPPAGLHASLQQHVFQRAELQPQPAQQQQALQAQQAQLAQHPCGACTLLLRSDPPARSAAAPAALEPAAPLSSGQPRPEPSCAGSRCSCDTSVVVACQQGGSWDAPRRQQQQVGSEPPAGGEDAFHEAAALPNAGSLDDSLYPADVWDSLLIDSGVLSRLLEGDSDGGLLC
ncbi:hypothetical protein CHLNCDRAFT_145560 [Chlorella variabilis]|uniref:MYB-CC type transcription factor LHEQLE-containing domain-containing protein n=1 Tax=Chlorella variabilis TaxID=554065 RepID=E1ZDR5_CHLVA|nr:hypothetical protein CHLNCDRAFT_145560 [Chlorella variabilis]EFN56069.1 hypothetical protein CHLNCDRAFT_145560 [Chlorella variabilis]|eukprot:XP_005848171.1 hypothetical protein CHLNCDRAFT_145560 [Chlorella variabilis]